MLRMFLWSIVPLGVAGGIGGFALHVSHNRALKAILESQATRERWVAMTLLLVLLVLAHVTVEAGRAQFALDASRRSAVKAWWRGLRLVVARPVAALGSYLVLTLVGLFAIAALGIARIDLPHLTFFGLLVAFILTQLIAAAAIWMRLARIFALVQLGVARNKPAEA
jgi:hypothetical protein